MKTKKTGLRRIKNQNISWKNDIIAMAGYWEPISHLIRNGMSSIKTDQDTYPYSHQIVRNLKSLGVNLFVWHYYKGLGLPIEKKEIAKTTRFYRILERHGMGKGAYVNNGSIYADTFLALHPEAKSWLSQDLYGHPNTYSEFYRRYFRFRPCHSHSEYGKYVAHAAVKAIQKSGADFISLDNCAQPPCYCEKCRSDFIKFVLARFPEKSTSGEVTFEERFGHPFLGHLELPRGTARWPIDSMPSAGEAGLQEWIRFRQSQYENNHRQISQTVRSLSKDTQICWNLALDHGQFNALIWGVDAEIAKRCQSNFIFSEDPNHAGIENGHLISHIRTFKLGRALGNRVMFHNGPNGNQSGKVANESKSLLSYAEAASFNGGCLGHVIWATSRPQSFGMLKKATTFFRANRDAYLQTKPMSEVAFLRVRESETITWSENQTTRLAVEQTLILRNIQYDYVLGSQIEQIFNYPAIVCAGLICVSTKIIQTIKQYVEKGGRMLCVGPTFQRDDLGRKRSLDSEMSLAGEWDKNFGTVGKIPKFGVSQLLELKSDAQSRLFELPHVQLTSPFRWDPSVSEPPTIGKEYFSELQNVKELETLLSQLIPNPSLSIQAPRNVIAGFFESRKQKPIIHLLDYEPSRNLKNITLQFYWTGKRLSKSVTFKTIDHQTTLPLERHGNKYSCSIPSFSTYGLIY